MEKQDIKITSQTWVKYLGQEKYAYEPRKCKSQGDHLPDMDRHYANYLTFFTDEIARHGVGEVLERFVFSRDANDNGVLVLLRFIGGA